MIKHRPRLTACLNGSRSKADNAAVPTTPAELAQAAVSVATLADAVHVHPRDPTGRESVNPEDVAVALSVLRGAAPGLPVGVTTGSWIESDPSRLQGMIAVWDPVPDFASVNIHELGSFDTARLLLDRGIDVEVGLWTTEAALMFLRQLLRWARARGYLQRIGLEDVLTLQDGSPAPDNGALVAVVAQFDRW